MESTEFRTPLSTAEHRPSPECDAPPEPVADCDLVTVPARQGLEAVDILRRGACDSVGPVLLDDGCDTLGFLAPPGTAAGLGTPGQHLQPPDQCRRPEPAAPSPRSRASPAAAARHRGTSRPTRPAVALGEAARLIEAAGRLQLHTGTPGGAPTGCRCADLPVRPDTEDWEGRGTSGPTTRGARHVTRRAVRAAGRRSGDDVVQQRSRAALPS